MQREEIAACLTFRAETTLVRLVSAQPSFFDRLKGGLQNPEQPAERFAHRR